MIGFEDVNAQIAQEINSINEIATPGDIIEGDSLSRQFRLASRISAPNIFGVITSEPAVGFRNSGEERGFMVLRTGIVSINVSLINGVIKEGDPLTSSQIPGYAMLASNDHRYLVGVALEDFDGSQNGTTEVSIPGQEQTVGASQIKADLQIGLKPSEQQALELNDKNEIVITVVRYVLAALVAIGSIFLSYRFFQLNVGGGLAALARNPLAKSPIQRMLILHLIIMIFISLVGLGLSVFILFLPINFFELLI